MSPCPIENPGAALPPGSLALTGMEWLPFAVLGAVLLIAGVAVALWRRRALAAGATVLVLLALGLVALSPVATSAHASSSQACDFLDVTHVDHPDAVDTLPMRLSLVVLLIGLIFLPLPVRRGRGPVAPANLDHESPPGTRREVRARTLP